MKKDCECKCIKLINELIKKFEKINNKSYDPVDFDLDTFKKASNVLSCSISTVRNAVDDGILLENIHYRHNGRKKYYFSTTELLKIKGTL